MELDPVGAITVRIVGAKLRGILVCEPPEFRHFHGSPAFAERRERSQKLVIRSAEGSYRTLQRRIVIPQIHVAQRGRLIENFVRGEGRGDHDAILRLLSTIYHGFRGPLAVRYFEVYATGFRMNAYPREARLRATPAGAVS